MRQFRSATTRVLLASGALFAAVGFAGASAAQDGRDATAQPVAYRGPYLSWAGKTSAPAAAPAPTPQLRPAIEAAPASEPLPPPRPAYAARSAPAQSEYSAWPAPTAPSQPSEARVEYITAPTPYAPLPRPRPERPATANYVARPAPQTAQSMPAPVRSLPKSTRIAPAPVQPASMAAQPAPKLRPAVVTATVDAPATTAVPTRRRHLPAVGAPATPMAQAQTAPIRSTALAPAAPAPAAPVRNLAQNDTPPAAEAPAAAPLPPTGVHYYSLHRAYGLTPDHVVVPKDRPMVLIGPADDSTPPSKDDSDSGKSGKHGDSDSADD